MASDKKVHMVFMGAVRRQYILYTDMIACLILHDWKNRAAEGAIKKLVDFDTERISATIHNFLSYELTSEMQGSDLVKNRLCVAIHDDIKEIYKKHYAK